MQKHAHAEDNFPMRQELLSAQPLQKPLPQQMVQYKCPSLRRNEPAALGISSSHRPQTTVKLILTIVQFEIFAFVIKSGKIGLLADRTQIFRDIVAGQ